jgi:protein-S-isoprenylcysteine O-methyltransferase Ste14
VVRLGGWLFPRRTWIPLPLIAALLLIPPGPLVVGWTWAGLAIVLLGEGVRLQAVRHIGVISRTRSDRLGPLIDTGPFAWVRNPLYLGNIALWIGFALVARVLWLAPIFAALLLFEYQAIVSWEESLLTARIGAAYVDYTRRVPRWIPKGSGLGAQGPGLTAQATPDGHFSWGETLFSERGTLIAIALGFALLYVKGGY